MGKNKLARWTEFRSYSNVIEHKIGDVFSKDHPIKGNWKKEIFKNNNPLILELGCGKGEYSVGLATRFPGNNYIGIDIKGARMWRGAKTASQQNLLNVAFLRTRIEFISSFFIKDEVDEIWVTFPDPHPGGRNANKRLTSPQFLNIYRSFLKDKGIIHLKTDNIELHNFTGNVVRQNKLDIVYETNDLYMTESGINKSVPDDILSIRTHYENIFLKDGLKITYISFRMNKEKIIEDAFSKAKGE